MVLFSFKSQLLVNSYNFHSVYNPVIQFKLNNKCWKMNFHHAALISTKILEKSFLNSSPETIEFSCPILNNDSYKIFEKYIYGGEINEEISPNVCLDLCNIGYAIGNELLMSPYLSTIENLELSNETLPKFFEYAKITGDYDKIIDFIGKNFHNIDKNLIIQEISKLGFDFAERLITSDSFTITSEEELAIFIVNLAKKLKESIVFLKYVKTAFVPLNVVQNIIKECRELGFDESDSPVLLSFLSEFFENSNKNLPRKSDAYLPQKISYVERKAYDEMVEENKSLKNKINKMDADFQGLVADLQTTTEFELSKQKIQFDIRLSSIKSILLVNSEQILRFQRNSSDFNSIYKCFVDYCKHNDTRSILIGILGNFHEIRSPQGNNILLEAAARNNYNLASALVKCSADPNCQNSEGDTILHFFCRHGNVDAVRFFVSIMNVNHFNVNKESPMTIAIENNNQEIADILIQHDHTGK